MEITNAEIKLKSCLILKSCTLQSSVLDPSRVATNKNVAVLNFDHCKIFMVQCDCLLQLTFDPKLFALWVVIRVSAEVLIQ